MKGDYNMLYLEDLKEIEKLCNQLDKINRMIEEGIMNIAWTKNQILSCGTEIGEIHSRIGDILNLVQQDAIKSLKIHLNDIKQQLLEELLLFGVDLTINS
jgi:hypothetical protein